MVNVLKQHFLQVAVRNDKKTKPFGSSEIRITRNTYRKIVQEKTRFNVMSVFMWNRGNLFALLGPNGAGKTSLFYIITGLVESNEGRITLDGQDITPLPMYRRARLGLGYLPQEASIFRGLNVEDNIRANFTNQ